MDYSYYIQFENKLKIKDVDRQFDPASISKIFYILFLLKKFDLAELNVRKLKLHWSDIRKYGRGTQYLRWYHVGKTFMISELMSFSIVHSCNVSTGMLADFAGRTEVNEFIKQYLQLTKTSIFSSNSRNLTSIADLVKTLQAIVETNLLTDEERSFLFNLMAQTQRRGVIRKSLPGYQVFSKGGTTFLGLRRDMAIIAQTDGSYGYAVIAQHDDQLPRFVWWQSVLAKFRLGYKSQLLTERDRIFNQFVYQLLH